MTSQDELVDLTLFQCGETERAIRVRNLKDVFVWLPKSIVEVYHHKRTTEESVENGIKKTLVGWTIECTLPQWLAEERELV